MTIEKRVRIVHDDNVESPRDWENVGKMYCWHCRYNLGDEHGYDSDDFLVRLVREADDELDGQIDELENAEWAATYDAAVDTGKSDPFDYANEIIDAKIDELVENALSAYVVLPLYLYDHSGISMSTGQFSCLWDSGQVGFIICDPETIQREFAGDRNRAEKALESEVEVYDSYLRGEVYGFIVEERCAEACTECAQHEDWNEVDSCYGFYGSDPHTNGMDSYLDAELMALAVDAEIEY